jgi:hypothetical protein
MGDGTLYSSPAWRMLRKKIMQRDAFGCQIGFAKSKIRADSVDHIVAHEDGGARLPHHAVRRSHALY